MSMVSVCDGVEVLHRTSAPLCEQLFLGCGRDIGVGKVSTLEESQ